MFGIFEPVAVFRGVIDYTGCIIGADKTTSLCFLLSLSKIVFRLVSGQAD